MSEPTRLLDGDVEAEKVLLRAWSGRQPSDASRLKALASVGIGGALLAAGTNAAATVTPKVALASTPVVKWLGLVVGVVVAAGVVGVVVRHPATHAPEAVSALRPPEVAVSPDSAHPLPSPNMVAPSAVEAPAPWVAVTPSVPHPQGPPARAAMVKAGAAPSVAAAPQIAVSAPVAPAGSAPSSRVSSTGSLDEEVLAIDHARAALAAGDAAGALARVDAYEAKYPRGVLLQESAEIRIEALYRGGKRAEADGLAARFLLQHPGSPYTRVLHSLAASAPTPAPSPP